jgi:hypothetical protein
MSTLGKREEELYQRGRETEPVKIFSQKPKKIPEEPLRQGKDWGKVETAPSPPPILRALKPEINPKSRRQIRAALAAVIAIGLLATGGYLFFRWWAAPSVTIAIEGPAGFRAGDKYSFEVVISNVSRQALEQPSVSVRAGSGVLFANEQGQPIGERVMARDLEQNLEPGSIRREIFSSYLLGKEGDERQIEISFRYRIPDIASDFTKTETLKVRIAAPAVTLILGMPKQTLSASDFAFTYEWRNLSELGIRFITAEIEYPQDFSFVEASPVPAQGARWKFQEELPSQHSASLSVVGRLEVPAGQTRAFRALLYATVWDEAILLGETAAEISIIENPLLMAVSVNGETEYIANPGDRLRYRITFKNNFRETLRDIVIIAGLSGRMFDFPSVDTHGAFDSRDHTITFHGGNTSQLLFLNPQESGSVEFEIKVLESIPAEMRNPTISVSAEMTSATRPRYLGIESLVSASVSIESRVNGIFTLATNVLLRDPVYGGTVIGPWPLRAGQTTQMSARLVVGAVGNDLENILVSTILPSGANYIGNVRGNTAGTEIVFSPRAGRLEWRIPRLAAHQQRELIFQIGVTPSIVDIGHAINILNPATLTGADSFTAKRVELSTREISSTGFQDPTVPNAAIEGRVRE